MCLLLPSSPPWPSPVRGPLTSGAAGPSWRATGGGGLAARKLALGVRRTRAWEADARRPGTVTKGGKRRPVRDREDRAWGRSTVSPEAAKASLASPGLHAGTWLAQAGAESVGSGGDSAPSGPAAAPQGLGGGAGRGGRARRCRLLERGCRTGSGLPTGARSRGLYGSQIWAFGSRGLRAALQRTRGMGRFHSSVTPSPPPRLESGAWPLGALGSGRVDESGEKGARAFKKFGLDQSFLCRGRP